MKQYCVGCGNLLPYSTTSPARCHSCQYGYRHLYQPQVIEELTWIERRLLNLISIMMVIVTPLLIPITPLLVLFGWYSQKRLNVEWKKKGQDPKYFWDSYAGKFILRETEDYVIIGEGGEHYDYHWKDPKRQAEWEEFIAKRRAK